MINRFRIMQVHMLLAGFLLPIAILYFIGGALYTLDIKGHIKKQVITLQLQQPFEPNLETLARTARAALSARDLPLPDGEPVLKRKHGTYELEWSDLGHRVTLKPGRDIHTVRLTVRERDLLTQIMRIHRAEAGGLFKFLAILLVIGLMAILATGVYMAQSIPKLRRPFYLALTFGVFVIPVFVLL